MSNYLIRSIDDDHSRKTFSIPMEEINDVRKVQGVQGTHWEANYLAHQGVEYNAGEFISTKVVAIFGNGQV